MYQMNAQEGSRRYFFYFVLESAQSMSLETFKSKNWSVSAGSSKIDFLISLNASRNSLVRNRLEFSPHLSNEFMMTIRKNR